MASTERQPSLFNRQLIHRVRTLPGSDKESEEQDKTKRVVITSQPTAPRTPTVSALLHFIQAQLQSTPAESQ